MAEDVIDQVTRQPRRITAPMTLNWSESIIVRDGRMSSAPKERDERTWFGWMGLHEQPETQGIRPTLRR